MKKLPKLKLRLPQKFVAKTRRTKILYIAIFLLVLTGIFAAVIFIINYSTKDKPKDQQVTQQLETISNEGTSCSQVVKEVGDISSDSVKDSDTKVELLEVQMTCFADQDQFDSAIKVAEKLKAIYSSTGDSSSVERIDFRIKDMQQTKTDIETEAKASNENQQ